MPNFEYTVTPEEAAHYDSIRQSRDWSWETLAAYFDQQTVDPTAPFLAAWAREQAGAGKSKRAKSAPVEKR